MTVYGLQLSTERLLEISEEVTQIASSLARLSAECGLVAPRVNFDVSAPISELSVKAVQSVIQARRLRCAYFGEALFADPAWDMILDLFEAELSGHRIAVSSLCARTDVPATTALRWIKTLVEKGVLFRRNDPLDRRRVFVELSPEANTAMRRLFTEIAKLPII